MKKIIIPLALLVLIAVAVFLIFSKQPKTAEQQATNEQQAIDFLEQAGYTVSVFDIPVSEYTDFGVISSTDYKKALERKNCELFIGNKLSGLFPYVPEATHCKVFESDDVVAYAIVGRRNGEYGDPYIDPAIYFYTQNGIKKYAVGSSKIADALTLMRQEILRENPNLEEHLDSLSSEFFQFNEMGSARIDAYINSSPKEVVELEEALNQAAEILTK